MSEQRIGCVPEYRRMAPTARAALKLGLCGATVLLASACPALSQEYKRAAAALASKKRVPGPPFVSADVKDKLELGKVENDSLGGDTGGNRVYHLAITRRDGVKPDQAIQIDASSSEFDTFIKLFEPGNVEPLLSDDNSAGGRNARLIVPPSLWGKSVIVEVSSKYPDEAGRFTLIAAATTYVPPEQPVSLALDGSTREEQFTEASARRIGSDVPVAKFAVIGKEGERFQVDVKSGAFDPEIEIDLNEDKPGKDSDSGDGTDARFVRTFRRSGSHILTVFSGDRRLGKYTVSAKTLPAARDAPNKSPRPISVGQSILATLQADSQSTEDHAFGLYELSGTAGQSIEITVVGTDPVKQGRQPVMFVDGGELTDAGFASVVTWARRSPSSTITLTFAKTGTVLLRASGALDFLGSYTISTKAASPRSSDAEELEK